MLKPQIISYFRDKGEQLTLQKILKIETLFQRQLNRKIGQNCSWISDAILYILVLTIYAKNINNIFFFSNKKGQLMFQKKLKIKIVLQNYYCNDAKSSHASFFPR